MCIRGYHSLSSFFFYCYGDHRDLHSFPTRRSSDLLQGIGPFIDAVVTHMAGIPKKLDRLQMGVRSRIELLRDHRSEEHTSELQSRPHLVCRLLLEKKNISHCIAKRPHSPKSQPSPL